MQENLLKSPTSEIRYKDRILEAIDQLRRRKARPDIQRICNFLLRRHSISFVDTKAALQKCVERDIVLKVEYKGSISYRNAARKYSHLRESGLVTPVSVTYNKPNRKFVALLTNAITELVVHEPDYLEVGIPGPELIRYILSKDHVRYTKKYVSILLEKEIESGGLLRMENGNYLLGPTKHDEDKSKVMEKKIFKEHEEKLDALFLEAKIRKPIKIIKKTKSVGDRNDDRDYKPGENGFNRVGRRRKTKKVFDPSDNNLPKKRGRPMGSLNKSTVERNMTRTSDSDSRPESRSSYGNREQGGVCSVCHNNKKVPNDKLVACRECSNKAHVSCLNGDDMMLKMYPDNTWQCPHCKTCCICYETSDAGYLVVCSLCADAYHAACHEPRVTDKIRSDQKWLCINCQMPEQLQVTEIHPNVSSSDVFTHRSTDEVTMDKDSRSPGLSIDEDSNHNSLALSPTPPTLSPQGLTGQRSSSPLLEVKCSYADLHDFKDMDLEDLIDPSIPDAAEWTCDDVYNYFAQYFPEEAKVFKEEEIDGRSLLLMKRMDVLSSLKLKLGTALKVYRHVVKLQFRRDDPKLYWL